MNKKVEITLEEARAAKKAFKSQYMDANVNGIGIGCDDDGFHVKVYLCKKDSGELPTYINNVPVKWEVVGEIVAQ